MHHLDLLINFWIVVYISVKIACIKEEFLYSILSCSYVRGKLIQLVHPQRKLEQQWCQAGS